MRKELDYQADYGRDAGKMFRITEMSARQIDRWCLRAFFTLLNAKADIPEELASSGFAGLMSLGLDAFAKVPYEAALPLWDELLDCVKYIPTPKQPNITRPLIEEDVEEVRTLLKLRKAVFDLHNDFLKKESPST